MPYYKGTYYDSKAAVVRAMYADGSLTTSPEDKKRVAAELGMTVQTVHATLVKIIGKTPKAVAKKVWSKPPQVKKPVRTTQVTHVDYMKTKQMIADRYNECYEIARSKGLVMPSIDVRYDLKGTVAGMFCVKMGFKYFRVNMELATRNIDDYLNQTVPHEFCHYIVRHENVFRSQPHGYEWKSAMIRYFNLDPKRCHEYDVSEVKQRRGGTVMYKCDCMDHPIGAVRHRNIQMGSVFSCRKCRGRLVLK